ncbi:AraC family transcriptional regulator [Formosa algae]|uniref:AraC family transcriptional regulator n=1 Tax=Formosa algae TaxID=225843 RepID=UPI000CCFC9AE|nr:GyrI-like domain-containing protein [Formosa algae]PNW27353.1 AraC family transcriptional regulator [Formosa algae]
MAHSQEELHTTYKHRINTVFAYIDSHLNEDLSLDTLSGIAFFSPYHFHRIFKFITNETLNSYVNRRRIEKAALTLIHKNTGITELAIECGFNDNSSFTRAFKNYYGVSPTVFRKENPNKFSKISQLQSKNGQVYPSYDKYICMIDNLKTWITMNANIEIKELPERYAAGLTHIGVHGIEQTFEKLILWANSKHLMTHPESRIGRLFYDSFKVTAPDKVRMSVFLITKTPINSEGEINNLTLNKGKCIVARFKINPNDFEKSWTGLFIWMNENGYQKSEAHPYEIYQNDFRTHPEQKCIVDLCIPIL